MSIGSAAFADPVATPSTDAMQSATAVVQQTPAQARRGRDPNARRCIDVTPVGTSIHRRVCHTNAEWDDMTEAARRMRNENDSRGSNQPCAQGGVCGMGSGG